MCHRAPGYTHRLGAHGDREIRRLSGSAEAPRLATRDSLTVPSYYLGAAANSSAAKQCLDRF